MMEQGDLEVSQGAAQGLGNRAGVRGSAELLALCRRAAYLT
jgi:hypothetical protein